jgi:hypothetical protein
MLGQKKYMWAWVLGTGVLVILLCAVVFLSKEKWRQGEAQSILKIDALPEENTDIPSAEELDASYRSAMLSVLDAARKGGGQSDAEQIRDALFSVRVPSARREAHAAAALFADTHSTSESEYWLTLTSLVEACVIPR